MPSRCAEFLVSIISYHIISQIVLAHQKKVERRAERLLTEILYRTLNQPTPERQHANFGSLDLCIFASLHLCIFASLHLWIGGTLAASQLRDLSEFVDPVRMRW